MINVESIELHASYHCNLSCVGCSHFSPYENEHFLDVSELSNDFRILRDVIHTNYLRILGGEPLLNPCLASIAYLCKNSQIGDNVSISTNGLLLKRWMDNLELWENIDLCEVTLYPCVKKTHDEIIRICRYISSRFKVAFSIYICDYFRIPCSLSHINDEVLNNQLFSTCIVAKDWQCFNLFEGRFYLCPQSVFLTRHDIAPAVETDSVDIRNNTNLEFALLQLINRSTPLNVCAYCNGSCGKRIAHSQNKDFNSEWSQSFSDDTVDLKYLAELKNGISNRSDMNTLSKIIRFPE